MGNSTVTKQIIITSGKINFYLNKVLYYIGYELPYSYTQETTFSGPSFHKVNTRDVEVKAGPYNYNCSYLKALTTAFMHGWQSIQLSYTAQMGFNIYGMLYHIGRKLYVAKLNFFSITTVVPALVGILLINHYFRGLHWHPLFILWVMSLMFLFIEGEK